VEFSGEIEHGILSSLGQRDQMAPGQKPGPMTSILQVLHTSKWIRTIHPTIDGKQKKWSVTTWVGTVVDGVNRVKVRYSRELADSLANLQPGTVIRLTYVPQYFKESDDAKCPWKMQLFAQSIKDLGMGNPVGLGEDRLDLTPVDPPRTYPPSNAAFRITSHWGTVSVKCEPPPGGAVECWGNLCGDGNDHIRSQCVVASHGRLDLASVNALAKYSPKLQARQREDPVNLLQNPGRRHVLYYWYATFVFGHMDRHRLPPCVVVAVRAQWPNPPGWPYRGYQSA
jgi:hypothetical protein